MRDEPCIWDADTIVGGRAVRMEISKRQADERVELPIGRPRRRFEERPAVASRDHEFYDTAQVAGAMAA